MVFVVSFEHFMTFRRTVLPQREIPVDVKTIQSAVMFSVGSSWQQLSGRLVSYDVAGPTPGPDRGG